MALIDDVKAKIEAALPGATVEIEDQSAFHVEHEPTGAHFSAVVTWSGFDGKSRVEQHKMVYAALAEELKQKVHALALVTKVA